MARGSGSALSTVIEHAPDFPLADGFRPKFGTSGFRGPAEKFLGVAFRCGVVTALRCYASKGDCGLVITASHNPVNDNGVKFVDFNGEMFPVEWEVYAQQIVDAETPEDLSKACEELCEKENISLFQRESEPYQVFMGHDTRPSAEALMQAAIRGIKSLNIEIAFEAILQTTPQVHFRVWRRYLKEACGEFQWLKYLAGGYMRLARGTKGHHGALTVDCANGVAAPKLKRLGECPGAVPLGYRFKLKNTGEGELNAKCGAEYIQKEHAFPVNFEDIDDWQRCASVDGDVDRAVYFTKANNSILVFDGDWIAALAAIYVQSLLDMNKEYKETYSMGIVLTPYANSALVEFLKAQGVEVMMDRTGVKNLYAAAKNFHVGIFYESNGHGSIIFSSRFASVLRENDMKETEDPATFGLLTLLEMMNQTVGDAVSNILLVEAVLRIKDWSLQDWLELYTPLPSKTISVPIENKAVLVVDPTETVCLEPEGLQEQIDAIVARDPKGRAFVRPSGTEDLVRIHVEASTSTAVNTLVEELTSCVQQRLKS